MHVVGAIGGAGVTNSVFLFFFNLVSQIMIFFRRELLHHTAAHIQTPEMLLKFLSLAERSP